MVDKIYVCRSCSYVFPKELSQLIDNKVQVYCEMCGTPFSLTGVEFRKAPIRGTRQTYSTKGETKNKLSKAIQILNKFDTIPIIIFSIIVLGLSFTHLFNPINGLYLFVGQFILGLSGILIIVYEWRFVSPRIEAESYDSIILDSLCYGILGCVIFGTGAIIVAKGVLILIYGIIYNEDKTHRFYNFGVKLKNSLNNFSAKAGFVILFLLLFALFFGIFNNNLANIIFGYLSTAIGIAEPWSTILNITIVIIGFSLLPSIVLLIDSRLHREIYDKEPKIGSTIGIFILGAIGTTLFNTGIFIFFKSIIMFFLLAGKPMDSPKKDARPIPTQHIEDKPYVKIEPAKPEEKPEIIELKLKDVKQETVEKTPHQETSDIKEIEPKIELKSHKDNDDFQFKLHESLLPVKDEKDKKVVKEYFSKIFSILSKDLREQINDLDIPKKERKELLQELAFLAEEEQEKYIAGLHALYSEFPKKLIERIRNLPNVKPQHYDKIIEQLKFMDVDEQIKFVQFLEKNA